MSFSSTIVYYLEISVIFLIGLFGAPTRIIYEYFTIKHPNLFSGPNNPEKHNKKVQQIQNAIRAWIRNGRNGFLCTSRPSWAKLTLRDIDKSEMNQIDVDLGEIVSIDAENRILTVEPRMKMGTLTHQLLPHGWTIPVVPEFKELTVGGLICGAGLETSSHKYGLFSNTCISYEVVLPNGEIVTCSNDTNSDLYHSIPMSYGTLGFLTAVQIRLIPAKKYVKLEYHSATDGHTATELLKDSNHEFVEGFQFSPNKFVITYGDFVDSAPWSKRRNFLHFWNQFFHWDVETYFKKPPGSVQFIPTRDYYHRHSNGYFWVFTAMFPFLKYSIIRILLGWVVPINFSLGKLLDNFVTCGRSASGGIGNWALSFIKYIVQDFLLPVDKLPEFLDMIHDDLRIYPLWLCPSRIFPSPGTVRPANNQETLYIDVGIYGFASNMTKNVIDVWKHYEKYTIKNNGFIGFYADSYLSREEFDIMFPPQLYLEMRNKYNCNGAFPLVYDKVSLAARTKNQNVP